MEGKLTRLSKNLSLFCLAAGFVLTPIFFLPITTDYFQLNKQLMFSVFCFAALLFWLIYNISLKNVKLTFSLLLLPLSLLTVSGLASSLINNPKNPEAWLTRPGLYFIVLLYFLIASSLINSSQIVRKILHAFIFVNLVVAILGIFSVLGMLESLTLPTYLTSRFFSPAGSPLNLMALLLSSLPISLILAFKIRGGPRKLFYFLTSGVILSCLILTGYNLLPDKPFNPLLLPKISGWSIAADTLKTKAFFGAGPNNFVDQFTQFKPIRLNQTAFWNINFTVSSNEYLHILSTLGLAGFLVFLVLIFSWLKLIKRDKGTRITSTQLALNLAVAAIFIIGLFVPFNALHWLVLAGYLSLSVGLNKAKNQTKVRESAFAPSWLPWLVAILGLSLAVFSGYRIGRVYLSEVYFQQSLNAANKNQGALTYNLQIKAINLSQFIDRYHRAYSNTNLALANSLSGQADLTDQDRQKIAQLVQQAIREARIATQLNPNRAANWQNLANLYRQLINFAQGADEFSIASYLKAIQFDPANPQLRLELGGLFYSLGRYEEAVVRFQEAVVLKPNFPNGYYNLSYAFQKQEKWLEAYQAMQQTLASLPANAADAEKAQAELNQLKTKLPAASLPKTETTEEKELTPPSPLPQAPKDFNPIEVEPSP